MFGMSLGLAVESSVAVLLAVTIGYCVVLNARLKRLHGDREMLAKMIGDLVQATGLANAAVKELKAAAVEADAQLASRLAEAQQTAAELGDHVGAGQHVLERIARITSLARTTPQVVEEPVAAPAEPTTKVQSALQQLAMHPRIRGSAA